MKNLKSYKIFESKSTFENLVNICKDTFAEYIDEGAYFYVDNTRNSVVISIISPESKKSYYLTIEEFYNYNKKVSEFIEDIMVCIKRTKSEIDVDIDLEKEKNDDGSILYCIGIQLKGKTIDGDIYRYNSDSNTIKFIESKFNSYFKTNCKIGIVWSSGDLLEVKFKDKESLNKNKEAIIKYFDSLKINGKSVNTEYEVYYSTRTGSHKEKYKIEEDTVINYTTSNNSQRTETVNRITFGLNSEFDFD